MLEDTLVALDDLEKVTFYFRLSEGEPLVASKYTELPNLKVKINGNAILVYQ